MSFSLVKYKNSSQNPDDFHFGRADVDGFPFRGLPPLVKEEEVEDRMVRMAEAKNGTFYTGDPEQNQRYLEVLDRIANGWYTTVFTDRWRNEGDNFHYIYLEWLVNYFQDAKK